MGRERSPKKVYCFQTAPIHRTAPPRRTATHRAIIGAFLWRREAIEKRKGKMEKERGEQQSYKVLVWRAVAPSCLIV